jgi:hypothetical protein
MRRQARLVALGAALATAAACGPPEADATPAVEAAASAAETAAPAPLDQAVAVARAIRALPGAADSILAAHGLTRAGFDSLMYAIAADSAMARAYTEAIR